MNNPWEKFFDYVGSEGATYEGIKEHTLALRALRGEYPKPVWMAALDLDDRVTLLRDVIAGIDELRRAPHDPESFARFQQMMRDWRTTGEQLADPVRRAVLLGQLQESPELD